MVVGESLRTQSLGTIRQHCWMDGCVGALDPPRRRRQYYRTVKPNLKTGNEDESMASSFHSPGPRSHTGRSAWGCAGVLWVLVGWVGVCVQASWCRWSQGTGGLHRGAADWRPLGVTRDRACEVDMREVSWRPVRSEDEMLTGAPLCRRMLTFLSFSIPV